MSEKLRAGEVPGEDPADASMMPVDRRLLLLGSSFVFSGYLGLAGRAEAAKSPDQEPVKEGDRFQFIAGDLKDQFLKPDSLEPGAAPIEGFPFDLQAQTLKRKNRLNRVLMVRLDPERLDEETRGRSADGVLVFSALCTHRACTIKSWKPEEGHLRCHCHLSEFSAVSGGSVMNGPATRALPMVPVALDDEGFVVAVDGFTGRVGAAKK